MEEHKGRANMEAMLGRKPLSPAEREASPSTVCVTGAAGFIGSRVVTRLLACGHTVHATCRAAGDDGAMVAALQQLPGAADRLHWFHADLLQEGSYDPALEGCRYVVHCAGVVSLTVPRRHGFKRIIEPTAKGVENILRGVNRTPTVERVVLTSSMAAVSSNFAERGEGHVSTEDDWNLEVLKTEQPYYTAKAVAEWHAWSMAAQQERWRLVSICPGNVFGPLMAPSPTCGPVPSMKTLMDGTVWPFAVPLGLVSVDLDDVAAAHVTAMVLPQARGRYLVCERAALMTEVAACLRQLYPRHWVPCISMPFWLAVAFLVPMRIMSYFWIKNLWGRKARVDGSKAQRELGLQLIPLEQTLQDFMDSLIEHSILPRMPAYSSVPAAIPLPVRGAGPSSRLAGASATVTAKLAEAKAEVEAAVGEGNGVAAVEEGTLAC